MTDVLSVTWWGHATTTLDLAGRRILTDPVLTKRLAHLSRVQGAVPSGAVLVADAVLISHLHHDHFHLPSLRILGPDVRILAPAGARRVVKHSAPDLLHRVEEVSPGDVSDVGAVRVTAVTAAHDGRRSPVSRHEGQALGFILETSIPDHPWRVWFAGDTGLFAEMREFAPVDLAVVPIGGWGPTLGPTHLDPTEAAEAVGRVGASDALPIHYGTFWPIGLRHLHPAGFRRHFIDPGQAFVDQLATRCPEARAHVVHHGETWTMSVPRP